MWPRQASPGSGRYATTAAREPTAPVQHNHQAACNLCVMNVKRGCEMHRPSHCAHFNTVLLGSRCCLGCNDSVGWDDVERVVDNVSS